MILVLGLSGVGAVTYRGYAVEKEKKVAEAIVEEARTEAERIQDEQDQLIINEWKDKVYPGVKVLGVDLSGKTETEAKETLETEVMDLLKEHTLTITAKEKKFPLTLAQLDIVVDADKLTTEAINFGKNLSDDEKLVQISKGTEKDLGISFGHSDDKISSFVAGITKEVNQEAKNATIQRSSGSFTVTEHAEGRVVDVPKLVSDIQNALKDLSGVTEINADIVVSQPRVTSDALKKIDGQLSSFTTTYGNSIPGRKFNVGFAASKINGAVIMPGETFSYNAQVGPVTAAAGFRNAGVYIGNKVEEGIGGGLCQVSSTLYQAALHSNLQIAQRRNHSMAVSYMKPGMDAVVYSPSLDLKFTNTYANPVYIYAYGDNSTLTVAIYGHQADMGGLTYKIFSETTSVIQPKTIEKPDPTMLEGTEEVEFKPVIGYTSKTYKQTLKNGQVIKTEQISSDSYKKVDKVVRIGTKKAPVVAPPVVAPTPSPTVPTEPVETP